MKIYEKEILRLLKIIDNLELRNKSLIKSLEDQEIISLKRYVSVSYYKILINEIEKGFKKKSTKKTILKIIENIKKLIKKEEEEPQKNDD